jgi:PAS domain-containing protein
MARPDWWSGLFAKAFAHSRNPMALVDDERVYVDVNGAYVRLTGRRLILLVALSTSRWGAAPRPRNREPAGCPPGA